MSGATTPISRAGPADSCGANRRSATGPARVLQSGADLRDFHDVVLKNGAVPLDILERIVNDYIASTLTAERA